MDAFDAFLLIFIMMLIFRIKIKYESFSNVYIPVDLKPNKNIVF